MTSPPWVEIRLATLAVSIVEPPPTETNASKPPSRAKAAATAKTRRSARRGCRRRPRRRCPRRVELARDPLGHPEPPDVRVRAHHRAPGAEPRELPARLVRRPRPELQRGRLDREDGLVGRGRGRLGHASMPPRPRAEQHRARVQDPARVERRLDRRHRGELAGRADEAQPARLGDADAVLGADRAAAARRRAAAPPRRPPRRRAAAPSTLTWTLPSPRWPKRIVRAPGATAATTSRHRVGERRPGGRAARRRRACAGRPAAAIASVWASRKRHRRSRSAVSVGHDGVVDARGAERLGELLGRVGRAPRTRRARRPAGARRPARGAAGGRSTSCSPSSSRNSAASSEGSARRAARPAAPRPRRATPSATSAATRCAAARHEPPAHARDDASVPSLPTSSAGEVVAGVVLEQPGACGRRPCRRPARPRGPPRARATVPWRSARVPPASVATSPPTVAESRAPKSTPASRPAARACACSAASVTPAPASTWAVARSTGAERRQPREAEDDLAAARDRRRRPGRCCRPAARPARRARGRRRSTRGDLVGRRPAARRAARGRAKRPVQSVS